MNDITDQSSTSGLENATSGAKDQEQSVTSGAETDGLAKNLEKALTEKKNAMSKLRELEAQLKKANEDKLVQSQQWKELAESRERELLETKLTLETKEKKIQEASVNGALRNELMKFGINGQLVDSALRIIDKKSVQVDPETGVVLGAGEVVKDFHKTFAGQSFFGNPSPKTSQGAPSLTPQLSGDDAFQAELRTAKTQKELEQVMRKYNKLM